MKTPINLFTEDDMLSHLKEWRKHNMKLAKAPDFTGGEEYYMGIVQGIDYALFILSRTGD